MRSFVLRLAIVVTALLCGALTGLPPTSLAIASTSEPHSPLRCPPAWSFVPYVAGAGAPSSAGLTAVSGAGPGDVWGVGQTTSGQALVLHFDGSAWNATPQPALPGSLGAVVAMTADDAWAVGTRQKTHGSATLVEHWNGAKWARVPDAGTGSFSGRLIRVVAGGPDDVWALGIVGDRSGTERTLIERWDGTSWSEAPPLESAASVQPVDLAVLPPDDAWVVGRYVSGGTMAQRFDGATWSIVPTPNVGKFTQANNLRSIAAVAPNDIWAGGMSGRHLTPPLIEHWNGAAWSVVRSERPPTKMAFTSMLAVSTDDVWALGPRDGTHIEHWDGRSWSVVYPIFTRGRPVFLGGFGSAGPGEIWAGAGARICPVVLSDTGMSPRYADTSSPIPLRAVRVPRMVPRTVAWRVDPLAGQTSSISEISLGLFDSGSILPGGSFTYSFQAAGTYSILHEPSGKVGSVGIPLRVRPPHGSVTQVFHVSWGFAQSDVEVKAPGNPDFVLWKQQSWDEEAAFGPTDPLWAGPGDYVFRSRVDDLDTGLMTDWSPTTTVRVR